MDDTIKLLKEQLADRDHEIRRILERNCIAVEEIKRLNDELEGHYTTLLNRKLDMAMETICDEAYGFSENKMPAAAIRLRDIMLEIEGME